jgi:hypothetical protein
MSKKIDKVVKEMMSSAGVFEREFNNMKQSLTELGMEIVSIFTITSALKSEIIYIEAEEVYNKKFNRTDFSQKKPCPHGKVSYDGSPINIGNKCLQCEYCYSYYSPEHIRAFVEEGDGFVGCTFNNKNKEEE